MRATLTVVLLVASIGCSAAHESIADAGGPDAFVDASPDDAGHPEGGTPVNTRLLRVEWVAAGVG